MFTFHSRNVGDKEGYTIPHWRDFYCDNPGEYSYDPDCRWCRIKLWIKIALAKIKEELEGI